jgi:hypothetical protein
MPHKVYIHRFKVLGSGQFPFDMLRYDACYPETSNDASNLINSDEDFEPRDVKLCARAERGWFPTRDRWRSFGWLCSDAEIRGSAIND